MRELQLLKTGRLWALLVGLVIAVLFLEVGVLFEAFRLGHQFKSLQVISPSMLPPDKTGGFFLLPAKVLTNLEAFTLISALAMAFSFGLILMSVWYVSRLIPRINRAAEIQRESYLRYRFLAEAPPTIGIIRFGLEKGIIKDVNRAALDLIKRSRDDVMGKRLKDFVPAEQQGLIDSQLTKLHDGRDNLEFEASLIDIYGVKRDFAWHVACPRIRDSEEDTVRDAVAVLTDVSERKRAEAERLERERLAGVLEMAGAAAHELNQPIQVIMGLIWRLEREYEIEGKDSSETLQKLKEEVERMADLGNKIANISSYKVKDYVGKTRIVDIDQASSS